MTIEKVKDRLRVAGYKLYEKEFSRKGAKSAKF